MRASRHEFELPAGGAPPEEGLREALAPRFSLEPDGRSRALRHTWLDTFDWRLHRAGLTLEHVTGRGHSELTLAGPGGERIVAGAARLRWPALAGTLPPGPLRAALTPVTGLRALMPAVRTASVTRTWRVLDHGGDTVAHLIVDSMPGTGPDTGDPLTRLTIAPVPGHHAQQERIRRRLAALPGLAPARAAPLETALAAAGRVPGDYPARAVVDAGPQTPARYAMAAVLLRLLDTLEAGVDGTVRDTDTEFLHDLRICVRRTRSALKLAGDVLPDGLAPRFRREFTWLGDATTPVRDLDVYLLNYPAMSAGLVSATPADLGPFQDYLARRRRSERRRLVRALRSPRFARLTRDWRAALTGVTGGGDPVIADLAAGRIGRLHRRVVAKGSAITANSPPERLHDLRKRCKELRYALEFFAPLHDPGIHRKAVRDLKRLQDCLGTFQDCQVQRRELQEFAAQMLAERSVPASALLAMGELAGQIAARQLTAREQFADRFARFAGRASTERFRALTAASRG